MRKDYMDDYEGNEQIDVDIDAFFQSKGLSNYEYFVDRHHMGDGKHRIRLEYKGKKEEIDIRARDGQEFLNEMLEDLIK